MTTRPTWAALRAPALALGLILATSLAACGGGAAPADEPAGDATAPEAAGTPADAGAAGESGTPAAAAPEGAATAAVPSSADNVIPAVPPTADAPVAQPTVQGKRRTVTLDEAVAAIPFQLLEPATLPKGTYPPSSVHLVEANEGQATDALPAVRMIYDIEGGGTVVLLQSPARGITIEGAEEREVGGHTVYKTEANDQIILTWEQDGVNLELRGKDVELPDLDAIIATMGPLGDGPTSKAMRGG